MVKSVAAPILLCLRLTFHFHVDVSPLTGQNHVSLHVFDDFQAGSTSICPHLHCWTFPASRDGFFISYNVNSDSRTGLSSISSRCTSCVSSTTPSNGLTATLIPNIEPTPLPSTDVWNQPEGLRPIYSDQTNAFIDAVHFPSPDHADEEALMDDLLEPNLPEPHQHVAAPPPDALPDPSKLSTTASTPPKRKQKAKATPKAPAKRRRLHEQSRSRSPSPLTNWTADEKQKLRTLKSDEKSRFSWRVISTKMGKSEADVRSMWNKLKDTLG